MVFTPRGHAMNAEQLPHLETFAVAAQLGSFTATARSLGLSQAAVSQRIQALEKSVGVSLFQRQAGRIALTEDGRLLYPFVQRILLLHHEARAAVSRRPTPFAGELMLAASSVPGAHLLPALLSTFGQHYPRVRVRATVTDSEEVVTQVEEGRAHLGLAGARIERPSLEFRSFARDRLALIVPAKHAWGQRKRIGLGALMREPLILREPGSGSRHCLEQALAEAGKSLRDLRVALELGSNEAIKEAVLRGSGAAFLSTTVVERELRTGSLRGLSVSGLNLERDMFLVWHRQRALPLPAQLFLDLVQATPTAGHKQDL